MDDSRLYGVTLSAGGSPDPDVGRGSKEIVDPTRDELFQVVADVRKGRRDYVILEGPPGSDAASITVGHPRRAFTLECFQISTSTTLEAACTNEQVVRDILTSCAAGRDEWKSMLDWISDSDVDLKPATWWQRLLGVRWVRNTTPD